MKLTLMILLSYFILWVYPVYAATMPIEQIELGKIIEINGQKFVKIGHDPVRGSRFIAFQRTCHAGMFDNYDLQEFSVADCDCLPTPSGINYTLAGTMIDSRDGKSYEVRKFADGKCWMMDNLAYGGASDACAGKTTFSSNGSATPSNTFGPGTYGDCRNNPGDSTYGYLYNWQAAMQDANAYYGNNYQPAEPTTGICPQGWHIPSGGYAGEFYALHSAVGFPETGFWQVNGNWKGVYAGAYNIPSSLYDQGSRGLYWSSSANDANLVFYLNITDSSASLTFVVSKNRGFAVRCVKDTIERTMQDFTTADCESYPTPSGTNYTAIGTLKDERDGKWYEIRKFADGKCWMVDNLAYGGASDACANRTTFSGEGSATPTNIFGTGTYGDCRNNPGYAGYLYSWQAAMQHASAYYGSSYTGPTTNVQGICPPGWHLPTGNTTGEYQALHTAAGLPDTGFWQEGAWRGVFSGLCGNSGSLRDQGPNGYYWASTQHTAYIAHDLSFGEYDVGPAIGNSIGYGFAVRCIKN